MGTTVILELLTLLLLPIHWPLGHPAALSVERSGIESPAAKWMMTVRPDKRERGRDDLRFRNGRYGPIIICDVHRPPGGDNVPERLIRLSIYDSEHRARKTKPNQKRCVCESLYHRVGMPPCTDSRWPISHFIAASVETVRFGHDPARVPRLRDSTDSVKDRNIIWQPYAPPRSARLRWQTIGGSLMPSIRCANGKSRGRNVEWWW